MASNNDGESQEMEPQVGLYIPKLNFDCSILDVIVLFNAHKFSFVNLTHF